MKCNFGFSSSKSHLQDGSATPKIICFLGKIILFFGRKNLILRFCVIGINFGEKCMNQSPSSNFRRKAIVIVEKPWVLFFFSTSNTILLGYRKGFTEFSTISLLDHFNSLIVKWVEIHKFHFRFVSFYHRTFIAIFSAVTTWRHTCKTGAGRSCASILLKYLCVLLVLLK